jgi:protease-4
MPMEEVEKIAKGRIWTGEDAKRLGLVDDLGGFPAALRLARQAAGIPEDEDVRLKVYPEKKSLLKRLSELKLVAAEEEAENGLVRYLEDLQPLAKAVESLGPSARSDVLRMQEFE